MAADIGLTCRVPAQPTRARLLDLSHYGCRVELANGAAEPGVSIVFEMPNGDRMNGEVMWATGREAGVRFAHGLRPGTAVVLGLQDDRPTLVATALKDSGKADDGTLLRHWYRSIARMFG